MKLRELIGDKPFYTRVLRIAVPIIVQNGITNFVGLLDNLMIGQLGTEAMSGAAIVNQILLVFNLAVFGAISGVGIFTTQYFGCRDEHGVRNTFRFKLLVCFAIALLGIGVFLLFGDNLISLYLHEDGSGADLAATLAAGHDYLLIVLIGLVPFALMQAYSGTLREGGEPFMPMISGICAILVNLVLNYILIYGKFGAPALGVAGAAIATVISRYVECLIIVIYTHTHTAKWRFAVGAFRSFRVPRALVVKIMRRGFPLLFNECLWAFGIAAMMQCYSIRGLTAVAALNIASTISNLFNVIYMGIGNAVSIIAGQHLGANRPREAMRDSCRLLLLSVVSCVFIGATMAAFSSLFPKLYRTTDDVRDLATGLILIISAFMPIAAFAHASYFVIRSGGKTILTFLFDSCFLIVCTLPAAYLLSHLTALPLLGVYAIVLSIDSVKCVIGFILIRRGVWLNNIVSEKPVSTEASA